MPTIADIRRACDAAGSHVAPTAEAPPDAVRLYLAPCTIASALRYTSKLHRHLPRLNGGLFAVAVVDDTGATRGVAIYGHPPRVWQGNGSGAILRVATDGARNACTLLMGALTRAAKALGYQRTYTWTLPEEGGASLRAAGFTYEGETDGGEWSCKSRPRPKAVRPEPKLRWRFDHPTRKTAPVRIDA